MNRILPENWREIFAKNVLNERERLDLTQSQLAEKLGMSSGSAISEWESGRGRARMDVFANLCEIFKRNPSDLMTVDLSSLPPPEPSDGKRKALNTEGHENNEGRAPESPPPKQEDLKAMKRQMLEMMMKLEELQS